MAWQNFHGAYDNTGPYANVVLGGNPGDTADFGFPLARLWKRYQLFR